jgi:hypothetical protein
MYTIMGLTGQVGGATAKALLNDGQQVRGIVRSKAKAASWESCGCRTGSRGLERHNGIGRSLPRCSGRLRHGAFQFCAGAGLS